MAVEDGSASEGEQKGCGGEVLRFGCGERLLLFLVSFLFSIRAGQCSDPPYPASCQRPLLLTGKIHSRQFEFGLIEVS